MMTLTVITSPRIGKRSIVMTMYVCMSVRDHIFKVHADLRPFYVTYGRGLVLLWRRSDMIYVLPVLLMT